MVLEKIKENEDLIVLIATKMNTFEILVGYYIVILHAKNSLVLLVALLLIWPKLMEMDYFL